jgi:hypothetical protein
MNIDEFWGLIQQARMAAGPAADQAIRDFDEPDDDPDRDYWDFADLDIDPDLLAAAVTGEVPAPVADGEEGDENGWEIDEFADPIAGALIEQLEKLPAKEIAAFQQIFDDLRARADRDDLANAAILIEHGFVGDESFDDFRAGMVALGREAYEAALADPDSLADHPIVREIAQANDPRWLGREELHYAASHAYASVTGEDEVTFYEFVESQFPDGEDVPELVEDDWDVTDEATTRQRVPKLAALFFERSMRNRARAMEKLGISD